MHVFLHVFIIEYVHQHSSHCVTASNICVCEGSATLTLFGLPFGLFSRVVLSQFTCQVKLYLLLMCICVCVSNRFIAVRFCQRANLTEFTDLRLGDLTASHQQ